MGGTFEGLVRLALMPTPAEFRELAQKCRDLAPTADERTSESLLMLAADYEAEAERLQAESRPRPAEPPQS